MMVRLVLVGHRGEYPVSVGRDGGIDPGSQGLPTPYTPRYYSQLYITPVFCRAYQGPATVTLEQENIKVRYREV